jgi:hypothetical protein
MREHDDEPTPGSVYVNLLENPEKFTGIYY